jgi:Ca2+-binding EF-hand superfamily protein
MSPRWCRLLVAGLLVVLGTPGVRAEEGHDFLLLTETGPLVLRLRLVVDGQPAATVRQRYLDALFADLDRDGDGFLSRTEAARIPTAAFLEAFLQGGVPEAKGNVAPFTDLDTDGDGRISRQEFDAWYRRAGLDHLRVVSVPSDPISEALTDVLFRLLDRNGDGRLSRAELQQAVQSLRVADFDGNEWITREELLLLRSRTPGPGQKASSELVLLPRPAGDDPRPWVQALLTRYDRNGDGRLSPGESGLDAKTFADLDRDGDGQLDATELAAFCRRAPDLELLVRLETRRRSPTDGQREPRISVDPPDRPLPPGVAVSRTPSGDLRLTAGRIELDLQVADGPDPGVRTLHQFIRQQFQAADADGRGVLTRRQAEGDLLPSLFDLVERDAEDRLTEQGLSSFLDLHARGAVSFTTLTMVSQRVCLFDLLDADGDGRLSLRELATAWDRLRPYDAAGAGQLSRADLPQRVRLRLTQGKAGALPPGKKEIQPLAPRGPEWFRKMDRNGDGYRSRRAWLGSEELFRRLDTDGDGLISPEEAERFDREKKP